MLSTNDQFTELEEVLEDKKYFFIMMEFVNGGDLKSFNRKLSELEVRLVIRKIAKALFYLR